MRTSEAEERTEKSTKLDGGVARPFVRLPTELALALFESL